MSDRRPDPVLLTDRTCLNCIKNKVCFAYKNVNQTILEMPVSRSTEFTPGTPDLVFMSLAGCCYEYQKKKQ